MFNKKYIVILIIVTISLSIPVYLNYLAFQNSNIQPILEEKFLGKITEIGNYTDRDYYNQREPEVILSKFDLLKPTYSILLNDCVYNKVKAESKPKNQCNSFTAIVFNLERTGILTWKVTDFNSATISQTDIGKARKTVANNDILKLGGEFEGIMLEVNDKEVTNRINELTKITDFDRRQNVAEKLPQAERSKICQQNLNSLLQLYSSGLKGLNYMGQSLDSNDISNIKKFIDTTDCSKF